MQPIVDPRLGDAEDDASSPMNHSLLSLFGSLIAEISLPKLAATFSLLIALPAVLLGAAPLILSAWASKISRGFATLSVEIWPVALAAALGGLAWFGGRPFLRAVEQVFWSLNSIGVLPIYALAREGFSQIGERFAATGDAERLVRLRAFGALAAGLVLCAAALGLCYWLWPHSRWIGDVSTLAAPVDSLVAALANSALILSAYFAVAALVWGLADATMPQPRDAGFDAAPPYAPRWRVALLSDIHVVGERFGFRIESGRSGPQGNARLARVLQRLARIHAEAPLDWLLITGDVTDAGRAAEWSEFLTALAPYPELAARTLLIPGNHDVNIVDRANPARLETPFSASRTLRELRALSGIAAVQSDGVFVVDRATGAISSALAQSIAPHAALLATFADKGAFRLAPKVSTIWAEAFPMVLPPKTADGLGLLLVNSTADTHFSFTNALGLVSVEQARAMMQAAAQFPRARWIVALHHHLTEYPTPAHSFSERIGTSLINGAWLVRLLQALGRRAIVMHGHRHVDWVGRCGEVRIVSAPSPVMGVTDDAQTYFHIHTLAAGPDGGLLLLPPERIEIPGATMLPL
jgi:hypothetical protein